MTLASGTKIGSYEVLAKLGAGGMGEVYRARDTTLNRDVAIKVLPELFAADPDRLARFTREAQTLAALNHPNIAQIYGVIDGALVMEFADGEDLSAIIARGPVPVEDAVAIARQIADALEAAHEQGIVHRDLKPANVKVTKDGTVKVLDFGLAKALGNPEGLRHEADVAPDFGPAGVSPANSPTLTVRATAMGVILGTAAYMAPEQARGKAVDRRADVWAFGVVLYEMLTGRRAFDGDETSDVLAAVLRQDVDLSRLPSNTPASIRRLLERCLRKDRRERLGDMSAVRLELLDADNTAVASPSFQGSPAPRRGTLRAMVATAVPTAVIAAGATWTFLRPPVPDAPVARFTVTAAGGGRAMSPQLTPDGRVLVFAQSDRLFRRALEALDAAALPGTDGAKAPMLSPDGASIAFFADRKLKRMPLAGGDAVTIAEANGDMPGACWCFADLILFSRAWSAGLSAVPADGGAVRQITTPDTSKGERGHWRPRPMPGRRVLFSIMMAATGVNDARIAILDLATGQYRVLFPGTDPLYLRSGHILYFHGGVWHAVPFDLESGRTTGAPMTVLADAFGVLPDGGSAGNAVSVSDDGIAAYMGGPTMPRRELVWVDRTGTVQTLGLPPHATQKASLSPDGRYVAMDHVESGAYTIWVADVARRTEDRLNVKGSNFSPVWDARGESLAFISERKGEYDAYVARRDGSGERALLNKDYDESPEAWSRDGRRIFVKQWLLDGSTPLVSVDASSGGAPETLETAIPSGAGVEVSPDDQWLLFPSVESGRREIYVRGVARGAARVRVSSDGAMNAYWSASGREIFFRTRSEIMVAAFNGAGGRADVGVARSVTSIAASADLYGVGSDGRFLVGRLADPEPPPGIRVVLNWFKELR